MQEKNIMVTGRNRNLRNSENAYYIVWEVKKKELKTMPNFICGHLDRWSYHSLRAVHLEEEQVFGRKQANHQCNIRHNELEMCGMFTRRQLHIRVQTYNKENNLDWSITSLSY